MKDHRGFANENHLWTPFVILSSYSQKWEVTFFRAICTKALEHIEAPIEKDMHPTDEELVIIGVQDLFDPDYPVMQSLQWLIPMCLDPKLITPIEIKEI